LFLGGVPSTPPIFKARLPTVFFFARSPEAPAITRQNSNQRFFFVARWRRDLYCVSALRREQSQLRSHLFSYAKQIRTAKTVTFTSAIGKPDFERQI
jgi:hypothetical protein